MAEYVEESVCTERQKNAAERYDRDKERLDKVEERQDKQDERTQKIEILTMQTAEILKNQNGKLEDHDHRIDALESKPGQWWDRLMFALMGAAASGLIAFVADILTKHIH